MALPALTKTWQFNVNQQTPASGTAQTDYANLVLKIKNSLIGFPSNPWTVVGSSNSVTAGLDGVDRWLAPANLVWANEGTAHSWIVLRQTGILPNFQLLINCYSNGAPAPIGRLIMFAVSPTNGFSGGSTTARPTDAPGTAGGETWARNGNTNYGYWFYNYTASFASVVHAMQSTDGATTRFVLCAGGKSRTLIQFDVPSAVPSTMTAPVIWSVNGWIVDQTYLTYSEFMDKPRLWGQYNSTLKLWSEGTPDYWPVVYATAEGYADNPVGNRASGLVANDITGEYPLSTFGLACEMTAWGGLIQRLGYLNDIWWGSTALADGTTYPGDGSKTRAQFGHLVFPWDGSVPLLT